jgi:hypothetical protein
MQNSYHSKEYEGYLEWLNDFRAGQVAGALGLDLAALLQGPAQAGKAPASVDIPGFPWAPRYVGLWARRAIALKAHVEEATEWRDWADEQPDGAPVDPDRAQAFIEFVRSSDGGALQSATRDKAVCQLVREAGGNAALAALLPDTLYRWFENEHRPVRAEGRGGGRRDGKPFWTVRHHQMGGHVPSSQDPAPIDHAELCLLQLQSDWGLRMILCDMGEADFWLSPADLKAAAFARTRGDTRGG